MVQRNIRAERLEREAALERIRDLIHRNHGMIKTAQLTEAGIPYKRILSLVEQGVLLRPKSGYYTLPGESFSEEESVLSQFGDGVLTMQTALYYHGYLKERPKAWTIAISKNTSKARLKLQDPPVKPYFTEEKVLKLGVEEIEIISGGYISIYTVDRLICDVMKYRDRLDAADFRQAIRAYLSDESKDTVRLMEFADARRVRSKVEAILGTWLSLDEEEETKVILPVEAAKEKAGVRQLKKEDSKPKAGKEPKVPEPAAPREAIRDEAEIKEPLQIPETKADTAGERPSGAAGDTSRISALIFDIILRMELVEDMGVFLQLYEILCSETVDGMSVSRELLAICEEEEFFPDEARVRKIRSWATDRFMEQKWEKYLRRQKDVSISWLDLMEKTSVFIVPIAISMAVGQPFTGDWMPEIGRFLE